jgi:hypothetical protein
MNFKIIESNKGGKCLLLDSFKYRKFRECNSGNVVWRCCIKNCTSTVTTCSQMKNLLKTKNTHKHEQVEMVKIKIQEVRNECRIGTNRRSRLDVGTNRRKKKNIYIYL